MFHLKRDQEVLLREYTEAGNACRGSETLTRNGLTIFVSVQAAVIGFIKLQYGIARETIFLELVGFVASVVTWISLLRLQLLYIAYIERAKCIERRVGMALYSSAWPFLALSAAPGQNIGNKKLLAWLPATFFVVYTALLIDDAPKYFTYTRITSWSGVVELIGFVSVLLVLAWYMLGANQLVQKMCRKLWGGAKKP